MGLYRGRSRTAATSKMKCFVIIINGFQSLTIITKRSILDVAAVLDPPLNICPRLYFAVVFRCVSNRFHRFYVSDKFKTLKGVFRTHLDIYDEALCENT